MPADLFMCERRPVRKMRENIISALCAAEKPAAAAAFWVLSLPRARLHLQE